MGAIAAVLLAPSNGMARQQPLTLSTAKAMMGHCEPAAGLVGLLTLATQLSHSAAPSLLHLRSLNPYVGSVLSTAAAASGAATVAMPRQNCGIGSADPLQVHGGVSSFAFQGTNAHAVLSASTSSVGVYASQHQSNIHTFQQERYWVLPKAHSFLATAACRGGAVTVQCVLSEPSLAFLLDHRVMGRALFPAAGMLELAAATAKSLLHDQRTSANAVVVVTNLHIATPVVLAESGDRCVTAGLILQTTVVPASGALQIAAVSSSQDTGTVCASCTLVMAVQSTQQASHAKPSGKLSSALGQLLASCRSGTDSTDAHTDRRRRAGSEAGNGAGAGAGAIGEVLLPEQAMLAGFLIPPQTLDSTLHLGVVAVGSGIKVPTAAKAFTVSQSASSSPARPHALHAVAAQQSPDKLTQATTDFSLMGLSHQQVMLSGLVTKVLKAGDQASNAAAAAPKKVEQLQHMYEVQSDCISEPYTGAQLTLPLVNSHSKLAAIQGNELVSLSAANAVDAASAILQLLHSHQADTQLPVQVLTSAAPAAAGTRQNLTSGLLSGVVSGLLRTAATEMSTTAVALHSVHPHSSSSHVQSLPASTACQLGFLNTSTAGASTLTQPQLARSSIQASSPGLFQLRPHPRGSLENLAPMPFDRAAVKLCSQQILVQVHAVGVNFRDVLNVLGMYPGDPGAPGADCSGVVMAVASGVENPSLRPGDAVFGIAPGSLGSCVITDSSNIVRMPPQLTFHEAASVPTVMLTAKTAFLEAAHVGPHDTVLVHAAAGGVGLAAIQVLQAIGATIIATAGSAQKRAVLHTLGVKQVINSRETQFAAEVAALGGVDVVLNSMTSPGMVAASLAALKPGGRFVEISKRGIWAQQQVSCNRPDCAYSFMAVDFLPPACLQSSLQWVALALTQGLIRPLCSVNHSLGNSTAAFRQMMQAGHVGKIVIDHPYTGMGSQSTAVGGSVAITGGLGGLGLLMAEWMTHQGSGTSHMSLISRTGHAKSGSAFIDMVNNAASVTAQMLDASFASDAAYIGNGNDPRQGCLPTPLTTLLHASGTLQDSMLQGQNPTALRTAFAPKVSAITAMGPFLGLLPMQHVALFSSVASLLGTAGQANYAAANAGLDAWAAAQEAAGCVAKAVQWGAWASAGMPHASRLILVPWLSTWQSKIRCLCVAAH